MFIASELLVSPLPLITGGQTGGAAGERPPKKNRGGTRVSASCQCDPRPR